LTEEEVVRLREELAAVRRREAELRKLLADAHEQLAERDDGMVHDLLWHSRHGQREVEQMRDTRVWRAGMVYWRFRDRLLGWRRAR
jgi:hypothetical protein